MVAGQRLTVDVGFAAFFLNRTNRSGILTGGVIGGKSQSGAWRMDVRFNKDTLSHKIEVLSAYSDKVSVTNKDAITLLTQNVRRLKGKIFVYLDPPYFVKSGRLYQNLYSEADHRKIGQAVGLLKHPWLVSYDDVSVIAEIYQDFRALRYDLNYSAATKEVGKELLFFSPSLVVPSIASPLEASRYG